MGKIDIQDLKILIVDGNVFIAKVLFSILEAFGIRKIIVCQTLEDAEKKFQNSELDCIFVDFMMEDRAGLKFVKKIRNQGSAKNEPDLPIILDTGMTDMDTIMTARDAGVSEIISKPFSPEQVLMKLENAVNNKREFINVDDYVGPNRRRHKENTSEFTGEKDRRQQGEDESE